MNECSAAILAGGAATRMGGANKALMRLGRGRVVDRLVTVLSPLFDSLSLVARRAEPLAELGLPLVVDSHPERCPLSGIQAALQAAETPYVFVVACDLPLVKPGFVQVLLNRLTGREDVVVPTRDGWYHYPLCAIYSKRCLELVDRALERGHYQAVGWFKHVRLAAVPLDEFRGADPDLVSLFNVNTPEDLARAEQLL